jgi:phosphohistidine phosphatase
MPHGWESSVRQYGLIPDVVLSSDAVRARLTAEAVAEAARYAGEIVLDPQLYMASPADILSLLPTVRENAETVMIVGHNPGLEKLVEQLTGERQDLPTAYPRPDWPADRSVARSQALDPRDARGPLGTRGTDMTPFPREHLSVRDS